MALTIAFLLHVFCLFFCIIFFRNVDLDLCIDDKVCLAATGGKEEDSDEGLVLIGDSQREARGSRPSPPQEAGQRSRQVRRPLFRDQISLMEREG